MSKLPLAILFLLLGACGPVAVEAGLPPGELQAQANGITVTAGNFRVERLQFMADVCFERPTLSANWLVGSQTSVEYSGKSAPVRGMNLLNTEMDFDTPHRCDLLLFPIGTDSVHEFRLVIPYLQMEIPFADCDTAQAKLDAADTGIVISCYSRQHPDGGRSEGYSIDFKPASLSDEEASQLASEAFMETAPGPWIFEGVIE